MKLNNSIQRFSLFLYSDDTIYSFLNLSKIICAINLLILMLRGYWRKVNLAKDTACTKSRKTREKLNEITREYISI
jgi:hypothetical protein